MINIIWGSFIILGIIFGFFSGTISGINNEILQSSKMAFDMIVQIFPTLALWLGIMNIAKESGLLEKLSHKITPVLIKLFPDIPKNHESFSYISSNIIANIFGLGNAATPFGLKAMRSLQTINNNKETASRSMITFLVLNTSGLTLIPTTVISLRILYKSVNPTQIVLACILATLCSTLAGIVMDRLLYRKYKYVK